MQRWVATAVLVGFIAAPALRAWCEIDCATTDEQPSASRSHCHEAGASEAPVSLHGPNDCGEHAPELAVAPTPKVQFGGPTSLVLELLVKPAPAAHSDESCRRFAFNQRCGTSPPISPGTNILRI